MTYFKEVQKGKIMLSRYFCRIILQKYKYDP
jgi:hypothetical protein